MTEVFEVPRHLDTEIEEFARDGQIQRLRRFIQAEPDDFRAEKLADYMATYIKAMLKEGITS